MIIKVYANSDHAYIVWKPDAPIPNCLGFAIYRRREGTVEAVATSVGPQDGPSVKDGTRRPSTEWPVQKFMWADYDTLAGDKVAYRVAPMCGESFDDMKEDPALASDWSETITLGAPGSAPIRAFFNRGVVSTQWVARELATTGKSLLALVNPAEGKTTGVRDFLGGVLKHELLAALESNRKSGAHIYASLFELNDPEVLPALKAFGQRGHIILSDGTHKAPAAGKRKGKGKGKDARNNRSKGAGNGKKNMKGTTFDENAAARAELIDAHVEVHQRMVTGDHFSHHKFIVFTDPTKTTKPVAVWTGSTNLTYGGICTQANNAIYIEDNVIAERYLSQWRELVKDLDAYPEDLAQLDAKPTAASVGKAKVTAWFAPNPKLGSTVKNGNKYGDHPDLKFARQLIQSAREGVLFLVFNPGYAGTLLNDILDLLKSTKGAKLYIHGVANQDPTGGADKAPLIFVHRNQKTQVDAAIEDDIVLPAAINNAPGLAKKDQAAAAAMAKWVKMVDDYWKQEPTGLGMVRVHSKTIVVDPFGQHPVVITGSHNLGPKASAVNDDNLVIIENAPEVAAEYAVNIVTIYNQYRWRFQQSQAAKRHKQLNEWNGLRAPWTAQASYFEGEKARELEFWT